MWFWTEIVMLLMFLAMHAINNTAVHTNFEKDCYTNFYSNTSLLKGSIAFYHI